MCIGRDKRLTIEHILLTCSDFIEMRESYFTAKSQRMLFRDISICLCYLPFKHGLKKKKKKKKKKIYIYIYTHQF